MGILDPANYQFELWDYFFWSGLVNAVVSLVAAAAVLQKNTKSRQNVSFFLFAMSLFFWSLPYTVWQMAATEEVALFWTRALMAGAVFVTVAMLNFTLDLLEMHDRMHRIILATFFFIFVFFFFTNLTPLFVSHVEPEMFFPFWPKPGILYHPYILLWMGCLAYATALLLVGYLNSSGIVRKQRKLILIGFVIGVVSGSTNYFLWYDIPIAPYANIVTSIYVLMISYAMMRYRLFSITPDMLANAVIETMPDMMFVIDDHETIAVANSSVANSLGHSTSSLKGQDVTVIFPRARDLIQKMESTDGGKRRESIVGEQACLKKKSGACLSVSASISRIPMGDTNGYVFICHDIEDINQQLEVITQQGRELADKSNQLERMNVELTESREAVMKALESAEQERALSEHERGRSETILRSIGDGVFVVDSQGRLALLNFAAERMSGASAERALGRPYGEIFRFRLETTGKDIGAFVSDAILTGKVVQTPHGSVLMSDNGPAVPVSVNAAPLIDAGRVFGAVVVMRDETREREIDRSKLDFISVASHQLRTPLSAMRWFIEMMRDSDSGNMNVRQREYLDLLGRSCSRLTGLVNDLLNASRVERGRISLHPKETDMDRLCLDVIAEAQPSAIEKGLKFSVRAGHLGLIYADPKLINQALANLLSNSIKYTSSGGTVEFIAERGESELTFRISDTGIGIPPDEQDKVFSKFFRGGKSKEMNTDGSGLGLYLVKSIIESSGGRIWFETEVGHGTTFHVTLPIGQKKEQDGGKEMLYNKLYR